MRNRILGCGVHGSGCRAQGAGLWPDGRTSSKTIHPTSATKNSPVCRATRDLQPRHRTPEAPHALTNHCVCWVKGQAHTCFSTETRQPRLPIAPTTTHTHSRQPNICCAPMVKANTIEGVPDLNQPPEPWTIVFLEHRRRDARRWVGGLQGSG